MRRTGLLALLVVVVSACGPSALSPEAGPISGGYSVTVSDPKVEGLLPPYSVKVGGIAAYDIERLDERSLRFTVQGAPEASEVKVVVSGHGVAREVGTFFYRGPKAKVFDRVVAFGASLTMGSQDANIAQRGQLHGPMAQLARQAEAYLPLPLIKPGLFPGITFEDFDRTTCQPLRDDVFSVIAERAGDMLPKLKDSNGNIVVAKSRVDPEIEVRNVAIGGFRLRQVLNGGNDLLTIGIEHMVWDPFVDTAHLIEEPEQKMMDRVEALRPTLVLSTDLFGNDYNNVGLGGDGIPDLNALTSMDEFRPLLAEVLRRLEATGAEVFLATGPDATVLPQYDAKIAKLRAAGFSEADATGWREAIRVRIGEYNDELRAQVAAYPRVHVVDMYTAVQEVLANGIDVAGGHLSPQPMGGLLSLDGMHFSDTGYAVLANMFIDRINQDLKLAIKRVDLEAVHAEDPYSVESLHAAGFPCAGGTGL